MDTVDKARGYFQHFIDEWSWSGWAELANLLDWCLDCPGCAQSLQGIKGSHDAGYTMQ